MGSNATVRAAMNNTTAVRVSQRTGTACLAVTGTEAELPSKAPKGSWGSNRETKNPRDGTNAETAGASIAAPRCAEVGLPARSHRLRALTLKSRHLSFGPS